MDRQTDSDTASPPSPLKLAQKLAKSQLTINSKDKYFEEIATYIKTLNENGYPTQTVLASVCGSCGGKVFQLIGDPNASVGKRICVDCSREQYVADSEEFWQDPELELETMTCQCGSTSMNTAAGFSFRDDGEIRWITVAQRCVDCGTLDVSLEIDIKYGDTGHLVKNI